MNAPVTKKTFRHYAVLALFSACMLAAQFSALQHNIHHPFHAHTHLCDSFVGFDHNSDSLTHHFALFVAFDNTRLTHAIKIQASLYRETNAFRIRGPPSLLI